MGSFCPFSQTCTPATVIARWILPACEASSKFKSFQNCREAKYIGYVIDPSSKDLPALKNSVWWHIGSVWHAVMKK